MRRIVRVLLPAVVGAGLLITFVPLGSAAATDVTKTVPLGAVNDIVVAGGKVFISGRGNDISDGRAGGIAVANVDGTGMTKLSGIGDTNGLVVGPDGLVYAAEEDGHIAQIDPATLGVTSFSTGTAGCPYSVAFAGTELWFSYGCSPSTDAGLAELNTSDSTITSGVLAGARQDRALLAGVPGQSELLATNISGAGNDLNLLSVSGTTATVAHSSSSVTVNDMDVSGDGSTVLIANGTNGVTYNTSDLSVGATTFDTPHGAADGVAYSPSGHYVAVSAGVVGNPDTITTFGPDSSVSIRTYDTSTPGSANIGQNTIPAARGIAWSGTTLLALYEDYEHGYPVLTVLTSAIQHVSKLTLSGPSSSTRTKRLTLTGSLQSGGALAGATLHVSKTDLDGMHKLSSVTTSGTGSFAVHDAPKVGGTVMYTVSYAGNAHHAPVSKSIKVTVSRATPVLTVKPSKTIYNYGQTESVTVHLGKTHSVRKVSIYVKPYGKAAKLVKSAKVNSAGNLSAKVSQIRNFKFVAKFAGDEWYAPRTVSAASKVRAKVNSAIGGSYAKSGGYHLFHQHDGGAIAVKVFPSKAYERVTFRLQKKLSGRWRTVDTDTEYLNQYSVIGVTFDGYTYTPYRVRGEFHGDRSNAAQNGKWWYCEFR